jgi:hypothetical protein
MADRRSSLVPGAVLLGVGFVFALDRFGLVPFGDAWYWGLVLGGALVFVFDGWDLKGFGVAVVGLVLWGTEHYELRLKYVWPVLLMAVGTFLVFQAIRRNRAESDRRDDDRREFPGSPPSN